MRLIYLDFDEPTDIDELQKHIYMIADMTETELELQEVWPTQRGIHVIVAGQWRRDHPKKSVSDNDGAVHSYIPDLQPLEIVCLQLLLGSDPKREAFNFVRAHSIGDAPEFWRDRWNLFFSEKL